MAGPFVDANDVLHGFIYSGSFRRLDVPGAAGTRLWHMRNNGQVAGAFVDALNEIHAVIAH